MRTQINGSSKDDMFGILPLDGAASPHLCEVACNAYCKTAKIISLFTEVIEGYFHMLDCCLMRQTRRLIIKLEYLKKIGHACDCIYSSGGANFQAKEPNSCHFPRLYVSEHIWYA